MFIVSYTAYCPNIPELHNQRRELIILNGSTARE
jgi:hypothetical protein